MEQKFDFKRRKIGQFKLLPTIESFLDAKRLQRRSERTIKTYNQSLQHYAKFCQSNGLIGDEEDCVKQYVEFMTFKKQKWDDHPTNHSDKIGISARSINNLIRNLRVFYGWSVKEKLIRFNPADNVEYQTEQDDSFSVFTDEEVKALLNAPNKRIYTGFRDYVMMLVLIDTGMRITEMTSLKRGDIDLLYRQIIIPAEVTKARKTRIVPISDTTAKALEELFELIGADIENPDEYIFLTQFGERYYGDTFAKMLKKYAVKANYPINARVSPHTFRHYFAVKFLRNGGDPFALMKILGHTDISMTQRYVRYAKAQIKEIHEKASPVESIVANRKKSRGRVRFR
jgi:integrase/recombinase XerD